MDKRTKLIKDIVLTSILIAILFVQEQILSFLPNIQLTVLLIVLFSKTVGLKKTTIIVVIHTLLDSIFMGSFSIVYFIPMLLGWLTIPVLLNTIFKKIESPIYLSLIGGLCALIYTLFFGIANTLVTKSNLILYLIADIPFTIILIVSSIISIIWLYQPLYKLMNKYNNQ